MATFKLASPRKKLKTSLQSFQEDADDEVPSTSGMDVLHDIVKLTDEGHTHASEGRWAKALSCWERALQQDPDSGHLHELKAQVLNELGRAWDAVQAATRATQLLPQSSDVLVTLARAQLNLGEPTLALSSLEKALKLQPDNAEALGEVHDVRKLALQQQRLGPGVRAVVGGGKKAAT